MRGVPITVVTRRQPDKPAGAGRTIERPHRTGDPPAPATVKTAGNLLTTVARIRRTIRRRAERPGVFSKLTGSQLELIRAVQRRPGTSVAEAAVDLRLA